jgi:hypothetical protein
VQTQGKTAISSGAGAGALVFGKDAPDVLWEMTRCVWSIGALPELMVWDREGCLHLAAVPRPWTMRVGWVEESPFWSLSLWEVSSPGSLGRVRPCLQS